MGKNGENEVTLSKENNKEKYIPYTIIIGIIILVILLVLVYFSLAFKKTQKIHYSDKSNLDYKVYLKKNDYYETDYLGKDKQYISSLIDYIDADFNYLFNTEDGLDLDYSYYIVATLNVANQNGKTIYDKEDYLVDNQQVNNSNGRSLAVKENVKIDYQKYNKLASEFIDNYGITSNATLTVSLHVNVNGKNNEYNKQIKENGVINMVIPLTNRTLDITMDYDLSNNKDAVLQYSEAIIKNPNLFYTSIILIGVELIIVSSIILYLLPRRNPNAIYRSKLNKILRDNERYISETVITENVNDLMKTKSLRIEIVKTFQDLMDIRDCLNKPILFHEENNGKEAVFYIISEKVGYIHIMSVEDFIKTKIPDKKNKNIEQTAYIDIEALTDIDKEPEAKSKSSTKSKSKSSTKSRQKKEKN